MATPKFRLHYFDLLGRAEAIRVAFAIGGIPFEDVRIPVPKWGEVKPTLPYQQVPVLEIDGKPLCQNNAILRYVGKLTKLYPACPMIAARVDEAIDVIEDFLTTYWVPVFVAQLFGNEEGRVAGLKKLNEEGIARVGSFFTKVFAANPSGYVAGSSLSIADLKLVFAWEMMQSGVFKGVDQAALASFAAINALKARVFALPAVEKWRATHRPYKLTYFNFGGSRADPIRLAFVVGGIAFEDVRVSMDQWKELKATMPFGQVPVLEFDGKHICQSNAILRFVGRAAGLYPTCSMGAVQVDEIIDAIEDYVQNVASPLFRATDDTRPAMLDKAIKEGIPKLLAFLNARLTANAGGYLVGSCMTVADLKTLATLRSLTVANTMGIPPTILDAFPALKDLVAKLMADPKIAGFYKA